MASRPAGSWARLAGFRQASLFPDPGLHSARRPACAEHIDTTVAQVRDVPVGVIATLKASAQARGQSLTACLRELRPGGRNRWP